MASYSTRRVFILKYIKYILENCGWVTTYEEDNEGKNVLNLIRYVSRMEDVCFYYTVYGIIRIYKEEMGQGGKSF